MPPGIDRFDPGPLSRPSPLLFRSHAFPAGFIAPCLPTSASQPPSGEEWLHEIKHDGFRIIARKDGKRVKLYKPSRQRPYRALLRPSLGFAPTPASSTARRLRAAMTGSRNSTASGIGSSTP